MSISPSLDKRDQDRVAVCFFICAISFICTVK